MQRKQHGFQYVPKEKTKEVKNGLLELIREVQNIVRDEFTFQYQFVGSDARNMITYDTKSNVGFDFDVNLYVNDEEEEYSAEEIRGIIRKALDRVVRKYGYGYCEDSTRVLMIKRVNTWSSSIEHSCDFAIVYDCDDGRQQYIRYNKGQQRYTWEYQPKGYYELSEKMEWIKKHKLWNDLRDYYLEKKNNNIDSNKKSRAIFAETVHEICQKNGYKSNLPKKSRR